MHIFSECARSFMVDLQIYVSYMFGFLEENSLLKHQCFSFWSRGFVLRRRVLTAVRGVVVKTIGAPETNNSSSDGVYSNVL